MVNFAQAGSSGTARPKSSWLSYLAGASKPFEEAGQVFLSFKNRVKQQRKQTPSKGESRMPLSPSGLAKMAVPKATTTQPGSTIASPVPSTPQGMPSGYPGNNYRTRSQFPKLHKKLRTQIPHHHILGFLQVRTQQNRVIAAVTLVTAGS